jgi:hypothetical protein
MLSLNGVFSERSGIRIKTKIAAVRPPAGRLIQKPGVHQPILAGRMREKHTPSPSRILCQCPTNQWP